MPSRARRLPKITLSWDEQRSWRARLARYTTVELSRLIERNGADEDVARLADEELQQRCDRGSLKPLLLLPRRPPMKRVRRTPKLQPVGEFVHLAITSGEETEHYALTPAVLARLVDAGVRLVTAPCPAPSNVRSIASARVLRHENGRPR